MGEPIGPVVLYVEDETAISDLAQVALEEAGYVVRIFASGPAALAALDADAAGVAALVTDIDLGALPSGGTSPVMRARFRRACRSSM